MCLMCDRALEQIAQGAILEKDESFEVASGMKKLESCLSELEKLKKEIDGGYSSGI